MWEGLHLLGDQISEDAERRQAEIELTTSRLERAVLAISTGVLAFLVRASSLVTIALSSLPVWSRVDPLSVLMLSDRDRRKREQELHDAETAEDESDRLGDLLDDPAERDHDRLEKDSQTHDEEIDG